MEGRPSISAVSSSVVSCHDYVPTSESEAPKKRRKKRRKKQLKPHELILLTAIYRRFKLRKILNSPDFAKLRD